MATDINFILKAIDNMSPVVESAMSKAEKEAQKAAKAVEKNWRIASSAISGIGIAIEGFTKKYAPLIEKTNQLAASLDGLSEGALRKIVIETSNVTFAIEDVLDVMEKGRQQGIESIEALQQYATFWDLVSDATGESSVALADASVSLRAVGIEVGKETDALSAFGFIQRETTLEISEFLNNVGRMGPEFRELGININDAAAMIGAMERELGLTSRVAITEFRTAVNQSGGDLNELIELLGLTEGQLEKYRQKVEESSGVIEENARINNEVMFTALDKIRHVVGEAMYAISPYVSKLSEIAPILIAVGPAVNIFISAKSAMATVMTAQVIPAFLTFINMMKAFGTYLLSNPLGLVVVAISAIITAIALLYMNWEKVVNFFTRTLDWLAEKFKILANPINWLKEKLGLIKSEGESMYQTFEDSTDRIGGTVGAMESFSDEADNVVQSNEEVKSSTNEVGDSFENLGEKVNEAADAFEEFYQQSLKDIEDYNNAVADFEKERQSFMESLFNKTGVMLPEYYDAEVAKLDEIKERWIIQIEASNQAKEKKIADIQAVLEWYDKEIAKLQQVQTEIEETADAQSNSRPIYQILDSEGNVIGATNMPQDYENQEGIELRKMHTGGVFNAPRPGGEGLAVLLDQERVSRPSESANNRVEININQGAVQFTGTQITEETVRKARNVLFDNIIEEMRRRGLNFA